MSMSDKIVVGNAKSWLSLELFDLLDVAQQVNDFTGGLNQRGLPKYGFSTMFIDYGCSRAFSSQRSLRS
jgi:hypothetical protein